MLGLSGWQLAVYEVLLDLTRSGHSIIDRKDLVGWRLFSMSERVGSRSKDPAQDVSLALQRLRDKGLVEFIGTGKYRLCDRIGGGQMGTEAEAQGLIRVGADSVVESYERGARLPGGVSAEQLRAARLAVVEAEGERHASDCRRRYDDLLARTEGYRVRIGELRVDRTYQRGIERAHVERLKTEFDPLLVGTLAVSLRQGQNGGADEMYVLDGQQRLQVFGELGFGNREVDAKVWLGLTPEEEARVFLGLNASKTINAASRLRARKAAGYRDAAEIDRAIAEAGFEIDYTNGQKPYMIAAVTAVEAVYDAAGGLEHGGFGRTKAALVLHRKLWNGRRSYESALIRAVGAFMIRHYGEVKDDLLAGRFQPPKTAPGSRLPWSPQQLISEGAGKFDRQPAAGAALILAQEHDRISGIPKTRFNPSGAAMYQLPEVKRARARGEC
jgi:hypothetical protein